MMRILSFFRAKPPSFWFTIVLLVLSIGFITLQQSSSFGAPLDKETLQKSNLADCTSACNQANVIGAPVITTQPQSQTIPAGTSADLSVIATGSGLSYQWYQGTRGVTTNPIG